MNIGNQLKKIRVLLGKSQEEFCNGVISESFYSRVENNKSNINAVDLLKLLSKNSVSLYDFFEPIAKENLRRDTILAFLNQDMQKLKEFYRLKSSNNRKVELEFQLMFAILEGKTENLSNKIRQEAEKQLLLIGKYDVDFLFDVRLLIPILNYSKLKLLIEYIIHEYQLVDIDDFTLKVLYQCMLAFIKRSNKENKLKDVELVVNFLSKIPKKSILILENFLLQYDRYVLTDDQKLKSLTKILKISGYEKYIELLCLQK